VHPDQRICEAIRLVFMKFRERAGRDSKDQTASWQVLRKALFVERFTGWHSLLSSSARTTVFNSHDDAWEGRIRIPRYGLSLPETFRDFALDTNR
jgi:hypothetical protein